MPIALVDVMLVTGSFVLVTALHFDGHIPPTYSERLFEFLPFAVAAYLVANLAWGLYGQIWRHASVAEARRVVLAGISAGAVIYLANDWRAFPFPRSVVVFGPVVAAMFVGLVRFQHRLFSFRRKIHRTASRVAVVGAGSAGAAIVREMRRSADAGLIPVVVVDDDPRKQVRALLGVPVVGDTSSLAAVVRHFRADEVFLAVPSADQQLTRTVMRAAETAEVPLKVLPPVRELLGGRPSVRAARDLRIEDLLGRQQVVTDVERIRAAVAGRRVLITGAGGSIGSEIAGQVAELDPALLVLLDHDETHLHDAAAAARARRALRAGAHRHPGPRRTAGPCSTPCAPRSCSTPPPTSTSRCWRPTRSRRCAPTCWAPPTSPQPPPPRRRPSGVHLDRQGGPAPQRARPVQAAGRADRRRPRPAGRPLVRGPLRQRARQPGQRHPDLRRPDRGRRPRHRHRPPHDPLLHERPGGGPARPPGRGPRPTAARCSCSTWASPCGSSTWPSA